MRQRVRKAGRIIAQVIALLLIGAGIFLLIQDLGHTEETPSSMNTRLALERQTQVPVNPAHHVLFLYSYEPNYSTFELEKNGIQDVLYKNDVTFDMDCLNTKKDPSEENLDHYKEILQNRINRGTRYEAVITGDDAALHFADDNKEELFPDIPVFFMGVNDLNYARSFQYNPEITGITERTFIPELIDIARKQKVGEKADTVVAILDDTSTGRGDSKVFLNYQHTYMNLHFQTISTSKLTRDQFRDALQKLDSSDIVLYLDGYDDAEGNYYSIEENADFIAKNCQVPVYRPSLGGVGQGFTGGASVNFYQDAKRTATMCVNYLKGADVSAMRVEGNEKGSYLFDENYIRIFQLDSSKLPKGTTILNQPRSYWDINRHLLVPMIFIAAGLLTLLTFAVLANVKADRAGKKLEKIYTELEQSHETLEDYSRKLEYTNIHDYLTGLLTRRAFAEEAEKKLSGYPQGTEYTIFAIDLDDLKEVNDSYSHEIGDCIIQEVAHRLQNAIGDRDGVLSRYGGDEYVLLLPGVHADPSDSVRQSVMNCFRDPVIIEDAHIMPLVSVGIVTGRTGDGKSVDQMIICADIALYQAKHKGKNTVIVFEKEMQENMAKRSELRRMVLHAFRHDEFYMVYQPKVRVSDQKAVSFEALVRIQGGKVSPGQFVPIIEESGWVIQLGRVTTELVIRQLAKWQESGKTLLPVSLNYSLGQLEDNSYVNFLQDLLEEYHVEPQYLQIEITETVFMKNADKALELFNDLREMGIRLLMDDFGSGYSNMEYLAYIPVDYIKIDKTIIDTTLPPADNISMLQDIIKMSHNLKKIIVAEGVETEKQFITLRAYGCDEIQGYYFDKPLSAENAGQVLDDTDYTDRLAGQ